MTRVITIVALVGAVWFWLRWRNTPTAQGRKDLIWKTAVGGLIVVIFLLALSGRIHWLGAVVAAVLPLLKQAMALLIRYFPFFAQLYKTHGPAAKAPDMSTVRSAIIEMTLNHETGELQGQVLGGPLAGQQLADMTREALAELLDYCRQQDGDSARLLESYLTQRFGNDADFAESEPGDGSKASSASAPMTVAEALAILGLQDPVSAEDITLAHRRLIQKLHPDRGGNDYLAAKINEARDVLLSKYS
ncbi:MAG: molecular chaperone DnaJ [Pseudomonadales bacterium]